MSASISQAATAVGVSVHTVRYYEAAGVIPPVPRDRAGHRRFDSEAMAWLEYAVCLRSMGMGVTAIRRYLEAAGAGDEEIIAEHLAEMRRRRDRFDSYIALIEAKLAGPRSTVAP